MPDPTLTHALCRRCGRPVHRWRCRYKPPVVKRRPGRRQQRAPFLTKYGGG